MNIVKHMRLLVIVFMGAGKAALPIHAGSAPVGDKIHGNRTDKVRPDGADKNHRA
jgi:hypothetical protein